MQKLKFPANFPAFYRDEDVIGKKRTKLQCVKMLTQKREPLTLSSIPCDLFTV